MANTYIYMLVATLLSALATTAVDVHCAKRFTMHARACVQRKESNSFVMKTCCDQNISVVNSTLSKLMSSGEEEVWEKKSKAWLITMHSELKLK